MVISRMAFEREQLAYIKSAVFSHKDNGRLERLTSPTKQLGIISKCLSWYYTQGNLHGISHALDFSSV
jgi:hypothetical protein